MSITCGPPPYQARHVPRRPDRRKNIRPNFNKVNIANERRPHLQYWPARRRDRPQNRQRNPARADRPRDKKQNRSYHRTKNSSRSCQNCRQNATYKNPTKERPPRPPPAHIVTSDGNLTSLVETASMNVTSVDVNRPEARGEVMQNNVYVSKRDPFGLYTAGIERTCVKVMLHTQWATALVDTGAERSFISKEFVDYMEMWDFVQDSKETFQGMGEQPVETMGKLRLLIEMKNIGLSTYFDLHVMSRPPQDCVLGWDFLSSNSISIIPKGDKLVLTAPKDQEEPLNCREASPKGRRGDQVAILRHKEENPPALGASLVTCIFNFLFFIAGGVTSLLDIMTECWKDGAVKKRTKDTCNDFNKNFNKNDNPKTGKVCSFYLQNRCKFDKHCRNQHPPFKNFTKEQRKIRVKHIPSLKSIKISTQNISPHPRNLTVKNFQQDSGVEALGAWKIN